MQNRTTLSTRIALAMIMFAVLLSVIGVLGLTGMSRSNTAYRETYTKQMPSAIAIDNAESFMSRERLALDRAAIERGTPKLSTMIESARGLGDTSNMWWKKYLELPRNVDEDALAQDVSSKRSLFHRAMEDFVPLVIAEDSKNVENGVARMHDAYNALTAADERLRQFEVHQSERSFNEAQSAFETFRIVSLTSIALGIIAAALAYFRLTRAITRPLAEALVHFEAISMGDLNRPVTAHSRDEMGSLLNGIAEMQHSLANTVQSVRAGSESIVIATRQIAAGNVDLSSRTEEQASALQQTVSSMDQLTATVEQNAENARQASTLAGSASEIASKGNLVVAQVVNTMGEINQSSSRIAEIIAIIEGIAFQTNILALNAAVEAARAGEDGRGFAVVAGEVRSLAQRSSAAAKEIKELIDTSVARVHAGSTLVDEAGRTMSEIIAAVRRVSDIMGEISAASNEQSTRIDFVARAVSQMDKVTQQNAALVEEAAASAQSLEDQAARLRSAVAVFRIS